MYGILSGSVETERWPDVRKGLSLGVIVYFYLPWRIRRETPLKPLCSQHWRKRSGISFLPGLGLMIGNEIKGCHADLGGTLFGIDCLDEEL